MATTDITERGLESTIVAALTGRDGAAVSGDRAMRETAAGYGGAGYVEGDPRDFDRVHAVDLAKLLEFLRATQPAVVAGLALEQDGPPRRKLLARLNGELARRGVVDVLRKGIKEGPWSVDLFYGTPTPGNRASEARFRANVFSVTRQLRYSPVQTQRALDLCLFVNGLPVATFELKNSLTCQTYRDAIEQYQRDRDPRETLFQPGRCAVHFAVDDGEAYMCAELAGKASWFLPFNQGWNDGAGNPPNPDGIKSDYLWKRILTREGLTEILERYAHMVEEPGQGRRKRLRPIFPRYHQLDVVRKLLADARATGVGRRYLIQHSAGSGKSNSIAWLVHQLVELRRDDALVFDTVVVVTDRQILDRQIRDTIKGFAEVRSTVGHADHTGDLRRYLQEGKRIVITTIQKFPVLIQAIGDEHRGRRFAIVIDEAHSSQGGRTAAKMHLALTDRETDDDETPEDTINRMMESRRMLTNASYFAFTATPKNKTLELFGEPHEDGGVVKHRPFHSYSMKQAIQERFILDVLASYTPIQSYYKLALTVVDDPELDKQKAQRKLRRYVESNDHAIRRKAEIMVDHFHEHVRHKIGGRARAMVVTAGIERAIQYYRAIEAYLREIRSPYRAVVAFSGEHESAGANVTEATLNGFPSNDIPKLIQTDPYRLLVVADKFQTGYDEPLLHTMYVDKPLSGIKAVQTLSRLNRACPGKTDTFVLDFYNDAEPIRAAFADYYRTTLLSQETDPNKLHDLKADLDRYEVYTAAEVARVVELFVQGADRDRLDPILDRCRDVYVRDLTEDEQIDFKGKAKAFTRTYSFLASVLTFGSVEWEKLTTFLELLIPKLPAPHEEDLSKGVLDAIDMDSYRVEVRAALRIDLPDQDAEIGPVPTSGGGTQLELALERLSAIVQEFNERFGTDWRDDDKIVQVITEELPAMVAADRAYQHARQRSDRQNARIESDRALQSAIFDLMSDHLQLFQRFQDDPRFKKHIEEFVFGETYEAPGGHATADPRE